jgi:hypothetical protein
LPGSILAARRIPLFSPPGDIGGEAFIQPKEKGAAADFAWLMIGR